MKKIFFCLAIMITNLLAAADSTFIYIQKCEYNKAIRYGEKKAKTFKYSGKYANLEKKIDIYNLACVYALTNNEKKSYEKLEDCMHVDTAGYTSYLTDPDFYNLVNKKSWFLFLQKNKPARYKSMNDTLYYNLSKIAIQDQALYNQLSCTERKFGVESKQAKEIWKIKDSLNKENLAMIEKYLADSINVLSNRVVREGFASHCFLVIQHSDTATMNKYLPIIKKLYEKGETKGENYALLYDRVMLHKENGLQYYGTQVDYEGTKVYPIKDERNVDKRRAALGMEPLKDYLLKFNIIYSPKK